MEDYKKKYKDTLENLKYIKETNKDNKQLVDFIEYKYPELKENEDERIRKELIRDIIIAMPLEIAQRYTFWLDKFIDEYEDKLDRCACESFDKGYKAALEKQDEQNLVDKVEPKFKVGDWVVQENIGVYNVIKICKSWYEVIDVENDRYSISFDKEYMCHLWSVRDAKDGDILVASAGSIFIFAGLVDCFCKYYVVLTTKNDIKISKGIENSYWETSENVHPTTKEQRDRLFRKILEIGCIWDSKKKEVKKIQ